MKSLIKVLKLNNAIDKSAQVEQMTEMLLNSEEEKVLSLKILCHLSTLYVQVVPTSNM